MAVSLETWSGIKATISRYYKPNKLKLFPIEDYLEIMEALIHEMTKGTITNFIRTQSDSRQTLRIIFSKAKCFKPITKTKKGDFIIISRPCVEKYLSWKSMVDTEKLHIADNVSIEDFDFTNARNNTFDIEDGGCVMSVSEIQNLVFIKLLKIILLVRKWYYVDFLGKKLDKIKPSDIA